MLGLLAAACPAGDGVVTPPSGSTQTQTVELKYDGPNAQAPLLAAATYEAAARFTTTQTAPLAGGRLTEIQFYFVEAPAGCKVKVYAAGSATSPGALLYEADVTASSAPNTWNSHTLQGDVTVPNGDLWIGIEFTQALSQRVIGCDQGPVIPGGDWLYASTDGSWITFTQRFSGNVNWNIRGLVEVPL